MRGLGAIPFAVFMVIVSACGGGVIPPEISRGFK